MWPEDFVRRKSGFELRRYKSDCGDDGRIRAFQDFRGSLGKRPCWIIVFPRIFFILKVLDFSRIIDLYVIRLSLLIAI
jgi:hypothetical protein